MEWERREIDERFRYCPTNRVDKVRLGEVKAIRHFFLALGGAPDSLNRTRLPAVIHCLSGGAFFFFIVSLRV